MNLFPVNVTSSDRRFIGLRASYARSACKFDDTSIRTKPSPDSAGMAFVRHGDFADKWITSGSPTNQE
jgi:hypothetical protein